MVSTFQRHNPHRQNFWNLINFLSEKTGYIDITRTKINLWSDQLVHKLYSEIVDKMYLFAQKQGKSKVLLFCGACFI